MTEYSYAYMHLPFQVPILKLNLHRVLDHKTYPGIVMTESSAGVLCKYAGDSFTIPYVNFMLLVHKKDEPKQDTSKKDKK